MQDNTMLQSEETDSDGWFLQQVQLGLDSANQGNLIPAEEVEAEFTARRAETLRKLTDGAS
jgi:predicted transcriptional regulator